MFALTLRRAAQPLPLGAVAMIGLGAAMMTNTLTFAQSFAAFGSEIPWCVRRHGAGSCGRVLTPHGACQADRARVLPGPRLH